MIDQGKKNVLGVYVDAVDYKAAVSRIMRAGHARKGMAVSALAVHGTMTGVLDATHRYRLNSLDLVVPDGQPVRWALNRLHHTSLEDRVYGPTLTLKICEAAAAGGLPIFLYGSKPAVLEALRTNLTARFPGLMIAGAQPSLFRQVTAAEKQRIVDEIHTSGAAITLVGLGCPRQEVWVYEYRDALNMPLIAVGAAFDFHAGTLAQAPAYMQRHGMEWLFRLVHEPRRLWKRYALMNPMYLGLLSLQLFGLRQFDPARAVRPLEELRYG